MNRGAKPLPFKASFSLSHDLLRERGRKHCPVISSAADIAAALEEIAKMPREVIVAGALDSQNRLLHCTILAIGTSNLVSLRIADVFHGAIHSYANAVFLAHNHPSGTLDPSAEDFEMTQKVAEAGILLGYQLIDHVIISTSGYKSILSQASLEKYKRKFKALTANVEYVADSSAEVVSWACPECSSRNTVDAVIPRYFSINRSYSIPVHCPECARFTWLSNARPVGSKVSLRTSHFLSKPDL